MATDGQKYDWSQNDGEITFKVPVPATAGKDKVKVVFRPSELMVQITGTGVLFNKELAGKMVPDDSYWALEGSGESRHLVLTLCKKKSGSWRTLTKEEEEALPGPGVMDENFDVLQLEHDDDDPERVEEQQENERKLEARYAKLKAEKGLKDEDTLQTFFALFDNCIQLYRLNKLSDYLAEVVPACRQRTDKYKLKAVQALAFVRWKQSRFREALPLFHEMEEIIGKGAALCENIAHTYNSLGDYEKAEDYFRQALKFIEQENGLNAGNRGGVLLGLGLVRDRLGKHKEALPVCLKAYEFYKERAKGAPASLQAKAGISCAKLHAKLGNLPKAEEFIREAVHMYEVTCGETSPLTASAYHELGKCLWAQRRREDAQKATKRAYEIESMKDAWDLVTLLEIHNLLMDTHLKETDNITRSKFKDYFKTVDFVLGRVRKELPQDGNAAVYYKAAGELFAWGGEYERGKALFNEAVPLLQAEKSTDCTGLIQACNDMLGFCDRNLAGTQQSPMDFEVSSAKKEKGVGDSDCMDVDFEDAMEDAQQGSHGGVVIEEIFDEEPAAAAAVTATPPKATAVAAPQPFMPEYRPAAPADFEPWRQLLQGREEPLLSNQAALEAHLAGAGAGDLCSVASSSCLNLLLGGSTSQSGQLAGFLLAGSDGVFGRVLQLTTDDKLPQDDRMTISRGLMQRCEAACRKRGLRGLVADAAANSYEDEIFQALGGSWSSSSSKRVHTLNFREAGSGGGATSSSNAAATMSSTGISAGAAPSSSSSSGPPKPRRDPVDTGAYYGSWDKMDVEKTLLQDDGLDPSAVLPEARQAPDDFGVGELDAPSKISKFAFDQSDKFVSLYIDCDGAGSLPADAVEMVLRPRGVLLVVRQAGKKKWFKVHNLCKEIDMEASTKKVKSDMIVLKLKKAQQGEKWSDLTDEKDLYQKKREYRIAHGDLKGATTEELLADMYKNANDEEREGLRDAMRVNRQKREEEASKTQV
eukprot:TRINITY_DN44995_c0_g1_i1.p1 TRINITY_DN44995_c0_g1~~TRINITY_DN44995_c0_g1_i1.p1  ORF type:complete len:984 (+),score=329.16 TRINITY_DN44995_c0_g1_i1:118-3069(+)